MYKKTLTLKFFIKMLKDIQEKHGDIPVGLDVYTNEFGEFWVLGKNQIKLIDGGTKLALAQLRLKKALPQNIQKNISIPAVDSIFADVNSALEQFAERYEVVDHNFTNETDIDVLNFMIRTVEEDMQNLLRLKEDLEKIKEMRKNANR